MYESIAEEFKVNDWKWNIGGNLQCPTAKDIEKTVNHAITLISPGENIKIGGLYIEKDEEQYYVYTLRKVITNGTTTST